MCCIVFQHDLAHGKHKSKLIAAVVIAAILAVAFFMGGVSDENNGSAAAGSAQMLQKPEITAKPLEAKPTVVEPSVPEQPAEHTDRLAFKAFLSTAVIQISSLRYGQPAA